MVGTKMTTEEADTGQWFEPSSKLNMRIWFSPNLANSVIIHTNGSLVHTEAEVASATAEFMVWWMLEIYPNLSSFRGIDKVEFLIN